MKLKETKVFTSKLMIQNAHGIQFNEGLLHYKVIIMIKNRENKLNLARMAKNRLGSK
jgi:hypothetical protein